MGIEDRHHLGGPLQDNYQVKINQLIKDNFLEFGKAGVHNLEVRHDDWCSMFEGNPCDCNAELFLDGKQL
jgi:hypothetical protein